MNKTTTRRTKAARSRVEDAAQVMSQIEFAGLGGGHVAYIKTLTPDDAKKMFPAIEGLPAGINLFALHAADGTPIALTDTRQAALSHAMDGELEVAYVH